MKNKHEIADIFRLYGKTYREQNMLSYKELKVMHKIEICRTAQLGGHIEQCDQCGFERIAQDMKMSGKLLRPGMKDTDESELPFNFPLRITGK